VVEREPPPLPSSDTLGELPSHPKSLSLGDSARRASVLSAQSVPSASNDEDDIDFDVHSSESSAGDSHDESDSDADDNAAGDANDEKPERTAAPAATRTTVAQRTVPVLSIAGAEKRKFAARGSVGGGVGDDDSSGGDEPGGESLSSHDMRFRRLMAMGAVGRAELLGVPALFLKAPTAKPDPRDINRPLPDTSQTLLHVAAVEGDLRGVRWLISHGALVDARDREGLTPLHYAIGLGRIGVARVLLEKEANPNAMTMVAWDAPAHFAARLPSSPELLALLDVLAENGALFDLPNKIDDTPLHEAAVGGERALLKWLLAAPGGRQLNVNAPNRFGDTPLHKAARAGNADAVRIMLRGGADINAVSESGTAADIAESCAHTHVADVLLEESGLRATPRAQPQYRIDMRPGNAEDISLRIDLSGLGMGNRFTPRTPRSPGSFGMRSRNKQWTRIMLRSPRPNNDKSDDSTPSSPSTGEPTSTVVSDGEQLSLLRTTNKKWVLRRPSPSTSNASSASNSGVWKKEFLVEPDAALDGDYVRSMLEKVDAEIASAGTDNSDDDDAIGEPAVTAAAATANSPTKDNASAATSATPPKKSEQEARNANAAAPQQPQAATGDAPQKKGSNRRRRRHRRPDDLPESATPAAVGATAAAAAAAAGATATPAAAAANSSSAATAVAAAVSTPMPTNATQQATVPSPPIEQASVICEGGACERCLAQSSSRCRWRCESLNRDVKLCSDCVRIMRETPNRCGLLLGTSDLTEFVGEKPASFDVHLLDEEELDIAATIQLDLQWDTWEFRDNFVRSDGQLERHKNCIGLSPFSPPVIVTFASELDKTALSFLAVVHSVADDYVYRVPVAVLKDKRAPTSKQLLHALSVMLERQYGPCVAVDLRSSNASGASTSASAGEPAPDFWRRWSAYRWVKVRDPALTIALLEFELHIKPTNYKFGVVLAPSGRTKVDEMLQVENATPAFNAFLNILGERIALRGWSGYRGDLDISSNCRTGERSVYAELDECQIMYHVSTMLPSDPHDAQQTARRMYLLSDIVVVVFLEGGHFSPHEFAAMSKQIHVILVVEPVVTGATTSYRLSVCARRDVPEFGPLIPHNFFFQPDDFFRDFLRTKMVNAERAALQAPFFARYVQRARRGQLTRLTEKFYDDGEEVGALSEPESGLQASGIKSKLRALGKRSSLSLAHSPIK
jgi:ankyrin repeat protein